MAERRLVRLRYRGYQRFVEPYVYGLTRRGLEALRCRQRAGLSYAPLPAWKLLRAELIGELGCTGETWSVAADYNAEDGVFAEVFSRVAP